MPETSGTAQAGGLRLWKIWYLLGAIMLLAVATVSLMPAPPQVPVGDKLTHLVVYLVLGAWFALLARNLKALTQSAIGLVLYGALLELLQGAGGYRFAEWADLFANGIGVGLGLLVYPTPLRRLMYWIDRRLAGLLQQ